MATRQALKRARQSLDRKQRKLVVESMHVERRKRELEDERTAAVLALRAICGRYGDNSWEHDTPLAEVIRHHLGDRLDRLVERARATPAPAPIEAAPEPPEPSPGSGPTPLHQPARRVASPPPARHATLVVLANDHRRGLTGYNATCTCGHRTPLRAREDQAEREGRLHCEQSSRAYG